MALLYKHIKTVLLYKTVQYWFRDPLIDQWNRIKNLKMGPIIKEYLITDIAEQWENVGTY